MTSAYLEQFERKIAQEDEAGIALPELNVDLLRETIEWAKKTHEVPDEFGVNWYQGTWIKSEKITDDQLEKQGWRGSVLKEAPENWCGTTACIAGSVALRFGGKPLWAHDSENGASYFQADDVVMPNGDVYSISLYAEMQLGLSDYESQFMFYAGCSLEDIEYIARRACERRGVEW